MPKQIRHRKRSKGIFGRVVSMFILVMVLDGALLILLLHLGGVFEHMQADALNILSEATRNKYQILQTYMVDCSNLEAFNAEIDGQIARSLKQDHRRYEDIAQDAELNAKLMLECAPLMISHFRELNITGLFVVLDGRGVQGEDNSYAGLYLRDSNPTRSSPQNNDIRLLRGLPPVSRELGISLDSYWKASFRFGSETDDVSAFFDKPLEAFRAQKNAAAKYFGWWSNAFSLDQEDTLRVITYSRPLVNDEGQAYGVIGIELEISYLDSVIANGEPTAGGGRQCYLLARSLDGGGSFEHVANSGARYRQNFLEKESLVPDRLTSKAGNVFLETKASRSGELFTGSLYELDVYSPNTPFEQERWVLIGLQSNESLFALQGSLATILEFVMLMGLILGVVIALFAARRVAQPFTQLLHQLKRRSVTGEQLKHSGLMEADQLADTITELNDRIREDASRISKIIHMSGMSVGVFERRKDADKVFCSEDFFKLLGCMELASGENTLPFDVFERLMGERLKPVEDDEADVYVVESGCRPRYLRMSKTEEAGRLLGTLIDVTQEMENRRRIEHERDHDILTGLLNRRTFEKQVRTMLEEEPEKAQPVSALMMIDMDNLKAMNDLYGHDCGDQYITAFADALRDVSTERCLMGRRSGDEFYLFFHGYANRNEVRARISQGWAALMNERFALPDGTHVKMRASAGIAWYPDDALAFERLIHFADFAMYRVKNTAKGTTEEFSRSDYKAAGFLYNGSTALDRLLDEQLVRFAYQPIVSARDASVMGYELLMWPQVEELSSPMEVLAVAKAQGKLFMIEKLTWYKALESAQEMRRNKLLEPGTLLFINSIASQMLEEHDELLLRDMYGEMYDDLVVEITESERADRKCLQHKLETLHRFRGRIAIDDLGSGYNSEASLISIDADYVKIDLGLVRNVDKDVDKRALVRSLVEYAQQHSMGVIAEGVETVEEMETLCALGVDYYQGYFVGRPAFAPQGPSSSVAADIRAAAQKYHRLDEL